MKINVLQTRRALRTALLVLLLSVMGMGKGYAQEFTVGDLNYSVNDDGVSVTVTGHVDGTSAMGALIIPASVTNNGHSYNVTEVGDYAFRNCSDITSVSLPNTVISIGRNAFQQCLGLSSITLPGSLTYIDQAAFQLCSNIVNTNYTGTLAQWCGIEFKTPNSNPIYYSHNLFINGVELTEAVIPETVTSIGNYAFYWCINISSLSIPETVTHIGFNAFCECKGLHSIKIPQSVASIGAGAFAGCSSLEQISVMEDNPYYDSRNNSNAIIRTDNNTLIAGCKNTTIPESVTAIEALAFGGCSDLRFISIPQSVVSIGERGFNGCTNLYSIISYAATPPSLGINVFANGTPATVLVVPCDCASAYETSDWHNHFTTIEEDCEPHNINIDEGGLSGGSVNTSVNSTNMGEEVQFTITPDEGMELASVTVFNANNPEQMVSVYPIGKANLTFGFIMPPFDVVIKAEFHPITTVNENDATWASIYPNPSNGQIRIEAEGIKHISISNMLGQTIYQGNAENDVLQYDFGKHEAGMYLIRIEAANGVAVKKVSVTR